MSTHASRAFRVASPFPARWLVAAATMIVLTPAAARGQRALAPAASGGPAPAEQGVSSTVRSTRPTFIDCLGTSFDRGCPAMLQYEAGYRARVGGRAPSTEVVNTAVVASWRTQWHGALGVMFPAGRRNALGVLLERSIDAAGAAADDAKATAFGARWSRRLHRDVRLDLTAGAMSTMLRFRDRSSGLTMPFGSNGGYGEVTLHAANLFALTVRDEPQFHSAAIRRGNAVYLGVRVEGVPAVIATLCGLAAGA